LSKARIEHHDMVKRKSAKAGRASSSK